MSDETANIHSTAVVLGSRGILFTGPSGSGKSMLAFTCWAAARRQGAYAVLISDDRVLISRRGDDIIAARPDSIAGLMELRGSGIVEIESVPEARLHLAVEVVSLPESQRLPPENEKFEISDIGSLPLIRIWQGMPDPLAAIAVLAPWLQTEKPFRL